MNNHIWQTLALSPTADTRAIKRAYAKVLKTLDPDDRNAFIALRDAYEQALQWAAWQEEDDGGWDTEPFEPAQEHSESSDLEVLYSQALDALPEPSTEEYCSDDTTTYEKHFIDDCWQSWQNSTDDHALLTVLKEQHQILARQDIATAIDYGNTLLDWFAHMDRHAPQAFAWAFATYNWRMYGDAWQINALIDRYPRLFWPKISNYPALQQWDDNWQKGFWARLWQALLPGKRLETEKQLHQFWRATKGEGEIPESLWGFAQRDTIGFFQFAWGSALGFFITQIIAIVMFHEHKSIIYPLLLNSWLFILIGYIIRKIIIFSSIPILKYFTIKSTAIFIVLILSTIILSPSVEEGLTLLAKNLAAILGLCGFCALWYYIQTFCWYKPKFPLHISWAIFSGSLFFIAWRVVYTNGIETEGRQFFAVIVILLSACFAYSVLQYIRLSDTKRRLYGIALLYSTFMPILAFYVLDNISLDALPSIILWLIIFFIFSSIIFTAIYFQKRSWNYNIPIVIGFSIFVAFIYGLSPIWLVKSQFFLWLFFVISMITTLRFPRTGFIFPAILIIFGQNVLIIMLPLLFWHLGWYLACAFSIAVVIYIMRMDKEVQTEGS